MVPLGLCTEVFINMNCISVCVYTIWLDVQLERRGLEHRRCSGPPPLKSTESLDSGRGPPMRDREQASRCPQARRHPMAPGAVSHSPKPPASPGAGMHHVLFSSACIWFTSHVPTDRQDSAATLGSEAPRCTDTHAVITTS